MLRAHSEASRRGRYRSHRRGRRLFRLAMEALEPRTLLSNVAWTGSGDGTTWTDAANWSNDAVPGASDDVTIDLSYGQPVELTSGAQSVSGLTMSGGTLQVTGSGVSLSVTGTTTVAGANLEAQGGGGALALPKLTSYSSDGTRFQADGAGSVLDVSGLTAFSQSGGWVIDATNGGEVNLSGLTNLTAPDGVTINDTGGGKLLDPKLSTLSGANIALDGTDTQAASAWTSFTAGTLTVTGGSYSLPGLTDVDDSNLHAQSGGTLALPGLKSYACGGYTFQADGSDSVLDVSALTTVTQTGGWVIDATNGGEVNLSGLTNLTAPTASRSPIPAAASSSIPNCPLSAAPTSRSTAPIPRRQAHGQASPPVL